MNTQSIYTYFVGRLLNIILLLSIFGGNAWAANLNGTIKSSPAPYRENCKLTGDLTIEGTNTVVVITGNLNFNGYDLTVKDGATLIVEGSVELHIGASITVHKSTFVTKYDLKGAGKITINTEESTFAILGKYDSNILGNPFSPKGTANSSTVYVSNKPGYNDVTMDAYVKATAAMKNNASLLPIELTSFSASQNGDEIEIAWTTNSEVNNDYFTVEYSVDGVSFKTLETVAGSGTTSVANEYAVSTDASELSGMVYFRLKQTDYNGEYSYSDVITLAVESFNELYVYPNPATDFVSVSGTYKSAVVQDMFGKKVAVATNDEQIFVGNLSAGTYYVVLATENGKKVLPFVKE